MSEQDGFKPAPEEIKRPDSYYEKERAKNQEKWEEQATEENKGRPLTEKFLGKGKQTGETVMQKEAERMNVIKSAIARELEKIDVAAESDIFVESDQEREIFDGLIAELAESLEGGLSDDERYSLSRELRRSIGIERAKQRKELHVVNHQKQATGTGPIGSYTVEREVHDFREPQE